MPLYEYLCPSCGTFEVIRKFSDDPLTLCPKCGSLVEKLFSAPAFHLKGTGWYITDYARKGQKGGDSDAPKTSTDSKSEPKPDSKSEPKSKSPAASKSDSKSTSSTESKSDSSSTSSSPKTSPPPSST